MATILLPGSTHTPRLTGERATPRRRRRASLILILLLLIGAVGAHGGQGTLAFYTSTANANSVFTSGRLNVNVALPSSTAFKWDTSGAGSNCTVISGATTSGPTANLLLEALAPNTHCITTLSVTNSGSLTANVRLRLIRSSASSAANDALNQALTLSLAQRTTAADTSACTTSFNFASPPAGWSTLTNAKPIGVAAGSGGLGVTGTLGAPPVGMSDTISGGQGADLWGGSAADNAPSAAAQLAPAGATDFCLKVTYPNTGIPGSNTTGDNASQNGTNTYYFVADAIQAIGR